MEGLHSAVQQPSSPPSLSHTDVFASGGLHNVMSATSVLPPVMPTGLCSMGLVPLRLFTQLSYPSHPHASVSTWPLLSFLSPRAPAATCLAAKVGEAGEESGGRRPASTSSLPRESRRLPAQGAVPWVCLHMSQPAHACVCVWLKNSCTTWTTRWKEAHGR